ncbi:MAG: hypothetical protein MPW15_11450 [Candidatus Manganitrophus sp.]|nr:hypothetical protein [Candidatus Manganitrophus sp.]
MHLLHETRTGESAKIFDRLHRSEKRFGPLLKESIRESPPSADAFASRCRLRHRSTRASEAEKKSFRSIDGKSAGVSAAAPVVSGCFIACNPACLLFISPISFA